MKLLRTLATLCLAAFPAVHAAPMLFSTTLTPEAPLATGSGSVVLEYDSATHMLGIDANFSGLSGTTTVAHIHCCVVVPGTGTAGVAVTPGTLPGFPVDVSAGSYLVDLDLSDAATYTGTFLNNFGGGTAAGAETALIAAFNNGTAYFNVHSNLFPAGEIRGFLAPQQVPEPPSVALLALGLLVAGAAARPRRGGGGADSLASRRPVGA